ncbi:MAG: ABC transporter ATP-binding protein [Gemmatimonadota bacterium]
MSVPVLAVENLRTWFRTEDGVARAVDGVSLQLEAGATLGLVGESGCGKSMTALSVLRLVPHPPGEILAGSSIRLQGRELLSLAEAEMREVRGGEIAMIFQEPMTSLNPVFTIGDQIGEAIREHRGLRGAALRDEVIRLLDRVGIPESESRVRAFPHQLSGGMRQRVMIAMALSCRPTVLIADEPTTALDVTIQAQILDLLRSLQAEFGMAILLITHDLGVVAEMADRVAVMYAGRVVEEGPVADFLAAPRHPYSEGLLRSVPALDRTAARLAPIRGSVPRPVEWPAGCRFHPRCRHAWERCREFEPPMLDAGRTRARCWLVEEPGRRATRGASGDE